MCACWMQDMFCPFFSNDLTKWTATIVYRSTMQYLELDKGQRGISQRYLSLSPENHQTIFRELCMVMMQSMLQFRDP